jgi:uncharacterized protein YgiM (DUF1202 family)
MFQRRHVFIVGFSLVACAACAGPSTSDLPAGPTTLSEGPLSGNFPLGTELFCTGSSVAVRVRPSLDAALVSGNLELARGEKVKVESAKSIGNWYGVSIDGGKLHGWVSGQFLSKTPVGSSLVVGSDRFVRGDGVALRSGPGTGFALVIGKNTGAEREMFRGEKFTIQSAFPKNGWVQGNQGPDLGWIQASYLAVSPPAVFSSSSESGFEGTPCAGTAIARATACALSKGAAILSAYRSPIDQERVRAENGCFNRCVGFDGCEPIAADCDRSPHTTCGAVDLQNDGLPLSIADLESCGLAKFGGLPHANHFDVF